MPAETEFPCHRSNAMNGKTAFVLLSGVLSGSLCACVQPPEAAAPAAPPPPPVAAPPPAPVAEPTPGDRWVVIRWTTCARLLELSPDDRAAASLFMSLTSPTSTPVDRHASALRGRCASSSF